MFTFSGFEKQAIAAHKPLNKGSKGPLALCLALDQTTAALLPPSFSMLLTEISIVHT